MNKNSARVFYLFILSGILLCFHSCSEEQTEEISPVIQDRTYQAENVVVVVIDGPRFTDTWGHEEKKYIPRMAKELAPQGVFFSNFRNNGLTRTISGHTAITTGKYQFMANDGSEFPQEPSLFQHYLHQTAQPPGKARLITSKLKLNVLADSRKMSWRGQYNPSINCGKGNENRSDRETLEQTIVALKEEQPTLMLVQFFGPDVHGHQDNWSGYLQSLQETDSLVAELWQYIQQDEQYKNKTALFITNDHGRHANDHKDGFKSHGDNCEDCRHISLLALGPDFEQGMLVKEEYELTDISPTIAQILGFHMPSLDGRPIQPLLNYNP